MTIKARLTDVHPVLMVKDVPVAIAFYRSLGFTLAFQDSMQQPKYAGIRRDAVELHLQWHDAEEWNAGVDRPTYRILVEGVDSLSGELEQVENLDRTPVKDTEWGTREFHVRDPDGNGLQFYKNL